MKAPVLSGSHHRQMLFLLLHRRLHDLNPFLASSALELYFACKYSMNILIPTSLVETDLNEHLVSTSSLTSLNSLYEVSVAAQDFAGFIQKTVTELEQLKNRYFHLRDQPGYLCEADAQQVDAEIKRDSNQNRRDSAENFL